MSSSVLYMSMSLDGFITGPDDDVGQGLGSGGERLHDWLGDAASGYRPSGPSGEIFDELMATGAVLVGRRTFDLAGTAITTASRSSCPPGESRPRRRLTWSTT
jgi:dihydrofolate reductase